jgi:hypothetical protein
MAAAAWDVKTTLTAGPVVRVATVGKEKTVAPEERRKYNHYLCEKEYLTRATLPRQREAGGGGSVAAVPGDKAAPRR